MECYVTSWSQWFAVNTEDSHQKVLYCCMAMHFPHHWNTPSATLWHLKMSNTLPWLCSTDFHLFWPFRDALRSDHFSSNSEWKAAVYVWLIAQSKSVFLYVSACAILDQVYWKAREYLENWCTYELRISILLILMNTLWILFDLLSYLTFQ
jgi:hypothetical protein